MQDNPRRSILAMVMALRRGHTQLTVSMCWMQKANPNLRRTFTMFYVKSNSHPLNLMKWTCAQNFQKNGHADIMGFFILRSTLTVYFKAVSSKDRWVTSSMTQDMLLVNVSMSYFRNLFHWYIKISH